MATRLKDDRELTPDDFAVFGLDSLIYVKPITTEDARRAFSVHGADGTPLAVMDERSVAFAAIVQQDMVPVSVH
jgi:hypothetical protein